MSKFYRTADRTVLLELFGPGESVENLKSLKANTTDAAYEYCNLHGLWKKRVPGKRWHFLQFPRMGRSLCASQTTMSLR